MMQLNGWFGYWSIWGLLLVTTAALWVVLWGILLLARKLGTFLNVRSWRKLGNALTLLVFLFIASCGFPAWRDQALRDVAEDRRYGNPAQGSSGSASSQTIEVYTTGGKHVGYGKVHGGAAEFFNADGSRVGFGRR